MIWANIARPGFLGSRRDEAHANWNNTYGTENWRLVWQAGTKLCLFPTACREFYEESYFEFLSKRPDLVERICSYRDVIDNAPTNVESGLDYTRQEAYSTHIQDIAVRNVMNRMGRKFLGERILQIRGYKSEGAFLSPGVIPFHTPEWIIPPSKAPWWAEIGSVEDFWQSNKYLQVLQEVQGEMFE
jgi:hypothetical protein